MALRGLPREGIPPEVVAGIWVPLCLVYCFQRVFWDISLHSLLELTSFDLPISGRIKGVHHHTPLKGGNWRLSYQHLEG